MTWTAPLLRHLGLARGKVLLLVQEGKPACVRELVRAIAAIEPGLHVCTRVEDLLAIPDGATIVLNIGRESGAWLNTHRPMFSRNRWRVVLWVNEGESVGLGAAAPDFMDWVTHVTACPSRPPAFALANIQALASERFIIWTGGELDETLRAWRPNGDIRVLDRYSDYRGLVRVLKKLRGMPLVRHLDYRYLDNYSANYNGKIALRKLRWAMAEARHDGPCIVNWLRANIPGFWSLHAAPTPWAAAEQCLRTAGAPQPGLLAALLDLEPEAIELAVALAADTGWDKIVETVHAADDPGGALGRMAQTRGRVSREDLMSRSVPSCVLRGNAGPSFAHEIREFHESVVPILNAADTAPDLWTLYMADRAPRNDVVADLWAARPPGPVPLPERFIPWLPAQAIVEASLRTLGVASAADFKKVVLWDTYLRHSVFTYEGWSWGFDSWSTVVRASGELLAFARTLFEHGQPQLAGVVLDGVLGRASPDEVLAMMPWLVRVDPQRVLEWLGWERAHPALEHPARNDPNWGETFVRQAWVRGATPPNAHARDYAYTAKFTEQIVQLLHRHVDADERRRLFAQLGVGGLTTVEAIEQLRHEGRLLDLPRALRATSPANTCVGSKLDEWLGAPWPDAPSSAA